MKNSAIGNKYQLQLAKFGIIYDFWQANRQKQEYENNNCC